MCLCASVRACVCACWCVFVCACVSAFVRARVSVRACVCGIVRGNLGSYGPGVGQCYNYY